MVCHGSKMTVRRVIFTGQSGIKIGHALNDFISKYPSFVSEHRKPLVLKIEDEMKNIHLKEHSDAVDSSTLWMDILMLPVPDLYNLWEKAFESVLNTIEKEENKNKDIFITLHTCFYLHSTVEYLTLAKTKSIKRFKPDLFITLIDDIYDIHDRLREPDQIFCNRYAGAADQVNAVFELMRILDWRANEIMITKHFANELGVPNYVFAVKHSYDTLYKLIFGNKPTFYISHPISEVRRLQKSGEIEKANQMIEEIHMMENIFSSEFVCFLPTTIDEFIIKQEEKENKKIYVPKLMSRWDSKEYQNPINLLFIPPTKSPDDPLWEKESKNPEEFHLLLKALQELLIGRQVSSRDHKLVEQSRFLFVYRPCFNGNISRGVFREIQYYQMLTGSTSDKKCFIYLPIGDQKKLKIKQLEKILKGGIKDGVIMYNNIEDVTLSSEEGNKLIAAGDNIDSLIKVLNEIIDNRHMRCAPNREVLDGDITQGSMRYIKDMANEYVNSVREGLNIYKQSVTVLWEEDNLSPEMLLSRVIKYLQKIKLLNIFKK